jgi:hypothetical protein
MSSLATVEKLQGVEVSEGVRLVRAIRRLDQLLPLKHRQAALPATILSVHRAILRSFAEQGRPLKRQEIAAMLGSEASALNALATLDTNDLIVLNFAAAKDPVSKKTIILDPKAVEVVGAYPFTMDQTPHKVTLFGQEVHSMCAFDGLGVAPMFNTETRIASKCHVTGDPIQVHQKGMEILNVNPPTTWFGIRWQGAAITAAHGL